MSLIKENYLKIALILLIVSQFFWLLIAPVSFKTAWSKNFLIAEIIKQHNFVLEKNKVVTISYYYPHFKYFAEIVSGIQKPDSQLMDGYHFGKPYIFRMYYQKIVDLFPYNDAGHFLLAYTEYYQNDINKAIEDYEKAGILTPFFFWTYYNLGVIYFQQQNYIQSAQMMTRALSLKREPTLQAISQTDFYRQIWRNLENPSVVISRNLEQGMQDAELILAACYLTVKGYDNVLLIFKSLDHQEIWHQELKETIKMKATKHEVLDEQLEQKLLAQIPVRLF